MPSTQYTTDEDLFDAALVQNPYLTLAELRELSPTVYSSKHDFCVLTRYEDVRATAGDWESFTSKHGVALTDQFTPQFAGSVLATDPPEHDVLCEVLSDKLAPRGLAQSRAQIADYANQLVSDLVSEDTFDGVTQIARVFPDNVVGDLVGFPQEGREKMQPGAVATFSGFGPFGEYVQEHVELLVDYNQWMAQMTDRAKPTPDGWGETIMDAVDDGRLTQPGAIRAVSAHLTARIASHVRAGSTAVVVGAGFLGMEVAYTLLRHGVAVTVIDRDPPLQRLLGDWLADDVVARAEAKGVRFVLAPHGVELLGDPVHAVRWEDHTLVADLIVSSVGDVPNVEWLQTSGLRLAGSVVVDGRALAAPGIAAAGDVATREVAPYEPDHYFWTEQFDLDVEIAGELPLAGAPTAFDGDAADDTTLLQWASGDGLAAVAIDRRIPIARLKSLSRVGA
ncbi:MAG: FAD-dependent oxidoreductase [Microbacterium sp.]